MKNTSILSYALIGVLVAALILAGILLSGGKTTYEEVPGDLVNWNGYQPANAATPYVYICAPGDGIDAWVVIPHGTDEVYRPASDPVFDEATRTWTWTFEREASSGAAAGLSTWSHTGGMTGLEADLFKAAVRGGDDTDVMVDGADDDSPALPALPHGHYVNNANGARLYAFVGGAGASDLATVSHKDKSCTASRCEFPYETVHTGTYKYVYTSVGSEDHQPDRDCTYRFYDSAPDGSSFTWNQNQ